MPISITCGKCSQTYEVSEKGAGRRFRCKGCGGVLTVPGATPDATISKTRETSASKSDQPEEKTRTSETQDDSASQTRVAKKKRASSKSSAKGSNSAMTRPRKTRPSKGGVASDYEVFDGDFEEADAEQDYAVDDDHAETHDDYEDYSTDDEEHGSYDDYEPAPRRRSSSSKKKTKSSKKKKKSSGSPLSGLAMTCNLNRLNIALVVLGGMAIFFGIREARLSAQSGSIPTTISLADLVANGPGDNIYLTVTGIEADLEETVIYYTEDRRGGIQKIDEAYISAKPIGAPSSDPVKLIVYSNESGSEMEVGGIASRRQHTGLLANDIMSISGEKRQMLDTVPGLNVDTAYILHERRTPSGAGLVIVYFLGGGLLLAGGLFWTFFVHS